MFSSKEDRPTGKKGTHNGVSLTRSVNAPNNIGCFSNNNSYDGEGMKGVRMRKKSTQPHGGI